MLNEDMDQVILVKGWKKSANWSFPRGKINKDEPDLQCAVREVLEETGFDLEDAGLVKDDVEMKYIEVTMREQHIRLYVFRGIPLDAHFAPRTRKEISRIVWYKLSELPTLKKQKHQPQSRDEDLAMNANKFYMVAPFMVPLKKWISQQKKSSQMKVNPPPLAAAPMAAHGASFMAVDQSSSDNIQPSVRLNEDHAPRPSHTVKIPQIDQAKSTESMNNMPEVIAPTKSLHGASAQLKSILQIQPSNGRETLAEAATKASATPSSNALLALLKPEGSSQPEEPSRIRLEQTAERKENLAPSDHGIISVKHTPELPSQAMFPDTSTVLPGIGANSTPSDPALFQSEYNGVTPLSKPAYQKPSLARRPPQKDLDPNVRSVTTNSQNIEGYQRADHPGFSQSPKIPTNGTPAISKTKQSVSPKLTAHSSLLLNMFKSSQPKTAEAPILPQNTQARTKSHILSPDGNNAVPSAAKDSSQLAKQTLQAKVDDSLGPPPEMVSAQQPSALPVPISQIHQSQAGLPGQGSLRSSDPLQVFRTLDTSLPPTDVQRLPPKVSVRPRSEHQDSLLKLFRESTEPKNQGPRSVSSRTLEVPSSVVELSALASPDRSREPSHAHGVLSNHRKQPRVNGQPSSPNQEPVATRSTKPSVFATVNGPLEFPEFDVLARTAKEPRESSNKYKQTPLSAPLPLPNLSRPVYAQASSFVMQDKTRVQPPSIFTNTAEFTTLQAAPSINTGSKPSQLQLLHRPSLSSQAPAVTSHSHPLPTPNFRPSTDRQSNQTQDHKQMLLSLFGKSSPTTNTGSVDPIGLVSPLSERTPFQQHQSGLITPLSSRSRIGSMASGAENVTLGGGRHTPRTTPVDQKTFLLDYLDGVVNGERR